MRVLPPGRPRPRPRHPQGTWIRSERRAGQQYIQDARRVFSPPPSLPHKHRKAGQSLSNPLIEPRRGRARARRERPRILRRSSARNIQSRLTFFPTRLHSTTAVLAANYITGKDTILLIRVSTPRLSCIARAVPRPKCTLHAAGSPRRIFSR